MNKHESKKLKLHKLSLRYLTTADLQDALGGFRTRPPLTKTEPPTGGVSGGGGGGTTSCAC